MTAVLPAAGAFLILWLVPTGCDVRGDAATYRWTCLFPGLLIPVPIIAAPLLLTANLLNNRSGRRVPDGWLVTILAMALLTQVVLISAYLLALDPAYRSMLLAELMLIPQPFVTGAIAGATFWVTLYLRARFGSRLLQDNA